MAEEIINIHRTENSSSLELGTPSKGGAIKVISTLTSSKMLNER